MRADVLAIELGDVDVDERHVVAMGFDHPTDRLAEVLEVAGEPAGSEGFGQRLGVGIERQEEAFDHSRVQALLAAEVGVDVPERDLGGLRDLTQPDRVVAAAREQADRGVLDAGLTGRLGRATHSKANVRSLIAERQPRLIAALVVDAITRTRRTRRQVARPGLALFPWHSGPRPAKHPGSARVNPPDGSADAG